MLPFILLSCLFGFVAFEIQTIRTQLGSDLQLLVPELCNSSQDLFFDVYSNDTHIGTHHGSLQGLNGYQDRLYFNPENCTITLRNLSESDGESYKITVQNAVNDTLVPHDMYFHIVKTAPEKTSSVNKTQDDSPSRVKLYVSAVLSLVPFVLACIVGIFGVLITYGKLHDQLQTITRGLQYFWIFTIVCQCISLGCWSCHGCLGLLLAAILIPVILIGDMVICFWRVYKNRGFRVRSVPIGAFVPIAKCEEESPDKSGGRAQVTFCGCWPRCGESSKLHYAALSPAVNPEDPGAESQEFWRKCWKRARGYRLRILLFIQLLFPVLVWIAYSTMDSDTSGEIFRSLYHRILPIFFEIFLAIAVLTGILVLVCDVVSQKLSGPEGSTFYLAEPKLCNVSETMNYDLHVGKDLIGFHYAGIGEGRLQYNNLLIFIWENCTFVLKNMKQEDTNVYILSTQYGENDKTVTHQTIFSINITDSEKNPRKRIHFAVFVIPLGVIVILGLVSCCCCKSSLKHFRYCSVNVC